MQMRLGGFVALTREEKHRPTDDNEIVFPANRIEANGCGFQQDESGCDMSALVLDLRKGELTSKLAK